MLAKLEQNPAPLDERRAARVRHLLVVLDKSAKLRGIPHADLLEKTLARRGKKVDDLRKSPVTTDLAHGALASWLMDDADRSVFERQTIARKAVQPLLAEHPRELDIALVGAREAAHIALYAAWVNGVRLPDSKKKKEG